MCWHFHQSGMLRDCSPLAGYCFKWTWKHDEWVVVKKDEICPQFFWKAPPPFNVFTAFLALFELELLNHYGHTGYKPSPDAAIKRVHETKEAPENE